MADESTEIETAAEAKAAPGVTDADFAEAVQSPSSFSVDGLSQTNRSLSEMIAADKYLRKRRLMSRGGGRMLGGMISHAITPGTCDR